MSMHGQPHLSASPSGSASESAGGSQVTEMASRYVPVDHEGKIWDRWLAAKAFHAQPQSVLSGKKQPYCIVIPPPNVTAALHLGHALNNTLQDVLTRQHRMKGFETLWMPGTDHAGIATQAVVEKRVQKEENKRRKDFTREQFVAKIQAFKDEYEKVITGQLQKMGCSCDWDRQRFTMDEQCARAVYEAFFRLFQDGLIYRGKRLVNWDPALQTAVADDECYDEEVDAHFYYLDYPLTESVKLPDGTTIDRITVATTRPETYLGDTGVAMNPRDPRAAALVGKKVRLPLINREIPIVADDYVVLPESMATTEEEKNDPKAKFATGFLKVTPAHDPNDYEIGKRHNLAAINIMAPDGSISDKFGWSDAAEHERVRSFIGLHREKSRKTIVKALEEAGFVREIKPYRHSIKFSDRSKAVIEPYLSDQWYVKVTDPRMAAAANAVLASDQRSDGKAPTHADNTMSFSPARYSKTFEHWHSNIRDWCISRQLWWGHRIPVWRSDRAEFAAEEKNRFGNDRVDVKHYAGKLAVCIRDTNDNEAISFYESRGFTRDEDVLDTWFSSALWPLSTLGWPSATPELAAFNPTSTLCTAREIITLWVSRMTMFNRYFLPENWAQKPTSDGSYLAPAHAAKGSGPIPFRDVVIHAVIQDGEGRKMSKSLGNGVDPLDIIESHGADAMRFTLCQMATQTQDVRLPVMKDSKTGKNSSPKFDLGRNFANKLWNAARFALGMIEATPGIADLSTPAALGSLTTADKWMLSRLAAGIRTCDEALANYRFNEYADTCYTLVWNDFCDWYLEAIKPTVANSPAQRAILRASINVILRLLHPVMPFVTESIHGTIRTLPTAKVLGLNLGISADLLCNTSWPVADSSLAFADAVKEFERLQSLVKTIREVRAQHGVKPRRKITLHLPSSATFISADALSMVQTLSDVGTAATNRPTAASVAFTFEETELHLSDLSDEAAIDTSAEKSRLEKLIAEKDKSIATLEGRLNNPGYALKAPPHMVQQTKDELAKVIAERDAAKAAMGKLA
ncbi:MAG: valine--tRNA ligase [Planctomycetes bacterium]|nr:valine--tRNA ligase [Planctomycetota bacterium]